MIMNSFLNNNIFSYFFFSKHPLILSLKEDEFFNKSFFYYDLYLAEERGLYPKYTLVDQMRYFGELRGIDRKTVGERIKYWCKLFNDA